MVYVPAASARFAAPPPAATRATATTAKPSSGFLGNRLILLNVNICISNLSRPRSANSIPGAAGQCSKWSGALRRRAEEVPLIPAGLAAGEPLRGERGEAHLAAHHD